MTRISRRSVLKGGVAALAASKESGYNPIDPEREGGPDVRYYD